ncbi:MAG: cell wall metabolism sensor histidine kinase WalK [Limosilactobacillus sp.]|nr:cell wall metabolism sensor histidine kinase WalK [Limosilactobacillus sp.]
MNQKIKFYQSLQFKIALVFILMLVLTLEIVGAVFVRQLERANLNTFKQQIELPVSVTNSLARSLSIDNANEANQQIKTTIQQLSNPNLTELNVVDAKGITRGTNQKSQRMVGETNNSKLIRNTLVNNRTHSETIYDRSQKKHYYVMTVPLVSGNDNNVVGAVYLRANLESVYSTVNSISLIYLSATVITIVIGLIFSVIISREITRPIEKIRGQTLKIAQGDFTGRIKVRANDELGQLAGAINNLSIRVEESQESIDSERRRLDSVLSHMTDGVLATDRRGNIIIANNLALEMLGVSAEAELIGKSILDMLDIRNKYTFRDLMESEQDYNEVILDNLSDEIIVSATFSPIQRESGFVSGMVCVLHDITDQVQEEEERKQFVSNVSHELRTPLTSVRSYVEALGDGAINDPELGPKFLQVVEDETDRMIRMINDLLSLSRMDAGTTKLDLEYVNISELFNYILDRFDMIIQNDEVTGTDKQYSIDRHITNKSLWVEIDPDKFTQVIDNIMNNAVKYSPDGGIITARLTDTHNHVILSIADQGLGIPRKDLRHVFDRFFRVDKARSRKQGGTGLGLAISKEVVNLLGGQIWVNSTEGKGSTFYIALPYVQFEEDDWDDQVDEG